MGEMRRAIACEEAETNKRDRFVSTLVIAAAIIAAVRLAGTGHQRPPLRVLYTLADSVTLARMIPDRVRVR